MKKMNSSYIEIIPKYKKKAKCIIYILIFLTIILIGILCISIIKFLLSIYNRENYIFNEKINKQYFKRQNDFCDKKIEIFNYSLYINKIQLVKARFNDLDFDMYVYKEKDAVSSTITMTQSWEKIETNKIIEALEFYSKKKI